MSAPYVKRYPGGFVDLPLQTTAVDSAFLNAVEAALLQLLGVAPAADTVGVWKTAGGGALAYQKITAAQIDPAAAIAKSQLAPLSLVDADVAGAAGIAQSKLNLAIADAQVSPSAAIQSSKLAIGVTTAFGSAANWNALTVNPVLSNGTATGGYVQLGKLIVGNLTFLMGSGTTFGTGFYQFVMPVAIAGAGGMPVGQVDCLDSSTGNLYTFQLQNYDSARAVALLYGSTSTLLQPGGPVTWAVGDQFTISFCYLSV